MKRLYPLTLTSYFFEISLKGLDKFVNKCYTSISVTIKTKEGDMTPVIRIDDEVMNGLKKKAVDLGLVFSTPNEVLRAIFGLDKQDNIGIDKFVDIEIRNPYTLQQWAIVPIPKRKRRFFPGYKLSFVLETDLGEITTHVTSAPKGTRIGDPDGGAYIQSRLRKWFDVHQAQLVNGATLHIEALEPGKRYKLSIGNKGV